MMGQDPGTSLAGRQVGPYQVVALVGAGGMCTVYRAIDPRLNRPIAIKVLSSELADESARRRFQQEAKMASALNHPHILTVHEVGEFEGRHYLVTEFVDGGTLNDWARAEKRSWRQIVELLVGVADGLAAAHAAGILHRDIKPANILVAKNGYAKLADFGLAKLVESTEFHGSADESPTLTARPTQPGVVIGTIAYMSPEQAAGKPLDARSDLFSFGVVLYELLARRRPFAGASDLEVLQTIIHRAPESLGVDVPSTLRNVVEKALEKGPGERYQSVREMVVDLKRIQRLETAVAPSDQASKRFRKWRWEIAAGVAAVTFLVVAGVFWQLWRKDYFWRNPLADAKVERLTDFEGDEDGAAISPDGKLAAFVSDRNGQSDAWVSQIGSGEFVNVTKGRWSGISTPGAKFSFHWVGFSGDGAQAWFVLRTSLQPPDFSTWLAPSIGGTPRPFLDHGMEPEWSPDGSKIVYHTAGPGDPIFIADRSGRDPKQIFVDKPGVHCHFTTWSRDGRFIYFVKGIVATEEMDIWRIPAGGGAGTPAGPERMTFHNGFVTYPAWLDSRTLIYSAPAEDGSGQWLYAMDVEHRIPHRVSSGITEKYLSVAVSATRPRRLVTAVATSNASLWTVPMSDRIQTEDAVSRFPTPNARAHGLRFAPGYLLFLSSKGGADGLWKLEDGAAREVWKGSDGEVVAPPAVSPDGSRVAFSYRKQRRAGLYVMSADGTNIRTLTESFDVRGAASWSPDGKWVVVAANQGQGMRIFKVPVDGGPPVQLVDALSYQPLWSPDGRFIVYSEALQGGRNHVKAVTSDKTPVPLPDIWVSQRSANPYRFVPNRQELVFLAYKAGPVGDFSWVNLETRQQRQLADLKPGALIQSFDISPDGKQIVFDRVRENSDIVFMDLAR